MDNNTRDTGRCQDVDLLPGIDLTLWVRLVLAVLLAALVVGLLTH